MTTLAKITITLLIALFLSSCAFDINFGDGTKGNGTIVTDKREINEDFTEVSASEGLEVYVTQGEPYEITVEADENVIDLIGTDIRDGELKVHAIKNIGRASKKIYVRLPEIDGLSSSSGASLIAEETLETNKISLDASSGSDLRVKVNADEVSADTSSGADINLSGNANLMYANSSSGSDINARDLEVKVCHADASSGSDISLHVTESLIAEASSGADISYKGDASVQKNNSVSGSVHKY